jgi:hypothetical protein
MFFLCLILSVFSSVLCDVLFFSSFSLLFRVFYIFSSFHNRLWGLRVCTVIVFEKPIFILHVVHGGGAAPLWKFKRKLQISLLSLTLTP